MILKRIKVSVLEEQTTNCYIIEDELSKQTMVIDPGGEVDKIIEMLDLIGADLKYIYLTHCHADHINGVNELRAKKGATVLIHRDDIEGLNVDRVNLATYVGLTEINIKDVMRVDENDTIHVGSLEFKVIHTPGHTKGRK